MTQAPTNHPDRFWLGVLVPTHPGPLPPPEDKPIGRAALLLAAEGLHLVFGDSAEAGTMTGLEAVPGGWREVEHVPVRAVHDRFPSQRRARRYAELCEALDGVPLGNPSSLTLLCRDKLLSQRVMEDGGVRMPAVESDPARFEELLAVWGAAFLKPRFGALGVGVRRVVPGDGLATHVESVVPGATDPAILQRAVPPPVDWSGWSARVLCQRQPRGGWWFSEGVVRMSRTDPVVNAARGATVAHAPQVLPPIVRDQLQEQCERAIQALASQPSGDLLVELGMDLAIDDRGGCHVIEVNSRPRGRLEALAEAEPGRWREAHIEACARPLRRLARLAGH